MNEVESVGRSGGDNQSGLKPPRRLLDTAGGGRPIANWIDVWKLPTLKFLVIPYLPGDFILFPFEICVIGCPIWLEQPNWNETVTTIEFIKSEAIDRYMLIGVEHACELAINF